MLEDPDPLARLSSSTFLFRAAVESYCPSIVEVVCDGRRPGGGDDGFGSGGGDGDGGNLDGGNRDDDVGKHWGVLVCGLRCGRGLVGGVGGGFDLISLEEWIGLV
jgi:hypothetical protein